MESFDRSVKNKPGVSFVCLLEVHALYDRKPPYIIGIDTNFNAVFPDKASTQHNQHRLTN